MITNEKILEKFNENIIENEDIYTVVKGKYVSAKIAGVEFVRSAFIGFSNKSVMIYIKETTKEDFFKMKYNEISRLDLKVNKKYFEIEILLRDNTKRYMTGIKDFEDIDFIIEIANIINL